MSPFGDKTANDFVAPWWQMLGARLFGKKVIGYDSGYRVTTYRWRGAVYVWRITLDTDCP